MTINFKMTHINLKYKRENNSTISLKDAIDFISKI